MKHHRNFTIAIDFDGVIVNEAFPGIGWGVRKNRQKAKPTRAEKQANKKAGPPVDSAKKEMGRMIVHTVGNLAFRLAVKRSLNFQDFSEASRSATNARREHEIKKIAQKVATSKIKSDIAQKQAVNAAKSKVATKVVKGAYDIGTMGRKER